MVTLTEREGVEVGMVSKVSIRTMGSMASSTLVVVRGTISNQVGDSFKEDLLCHKHSILEVISSMVEVKQVLEDGLHSKVVVGLILGRLLL